MSLDTHYIGHRFAPFILASLIHIEFTLLG